MKTRKLEIIVLMITIFISLATTVQASTGKINSKEVKLRKKADSSSTILDIIYKGDDVEILEHENGWYKVKAETSLGKITGYVSEEDVDVEDNTKEEVSTENSIQTPVETPIVPTDVKIENIEENKEYTIRQEVSIKAVPLINTREIAKISGNIRVIEIINNWSKIESSTESGWIRTNILKKSLIKVEEPVQNVQPEEQPEEKTEEQPIETPQEETKEPEEITLNKTGYVSTDGLRVRKGPSTDTEAIDSLEKNDKVEIIGQTGKWYKIELKGKIGYVSAKYISDTKLPETTSRGGNTLKTEEETPKVEETTPETPAEPSTSGTTGDAIVEYAKKYLGYKYVSGGASPSTGFDCSGFTTYVYKHFGISLNRTSRDQIKNGVAIEKSNLQPGDLVIFNDEANKKIGHVGIYIGDGNFIHASNPKDGVKITTLLTGYYNVRYVGARRVF